MLSNVYIPQWLLRLHKNWYSTQCLKVPKEENKKDIALDIRPPFLDAWAEIMCSLLISFNFKTKNLIFDNVRIKKKWFASSLIKNQKDDIFTIFLGQSTPKGFQKIPKLFQRVLKDLGQSSCTNGFRSIPKRF